MIVAPLVTTSVLAAGGSGESADANASTRAETRRTTRAALVALVITFAAVAGIAVFLGFPPVGSVIAGTISGLLAGALLLAAARRAAGFHEPAEAAQTHDDDERGLQ